jgi:hypothetical protein
MSGTSLAAAAARLRPAEEQAKLKGKICERCGARLQPHRMPEGYWWTGDEPWIDYRYGLVLNLAPDGKVLAEWQCDKCAPHVGLRPIGEPSPSNVPAGPPVAVTVVEARQRGVAGLVVGSPEAHALKEALRKATPTPRKRPARRRR